jgi:S-adenosylhomocysteine hydrolase
VAMKNEEIKILMTRISELEERKDFAKQVLDVESRTHMIIDKLEEVTHRLHRKIEECDQLK